MELMDWQRRVCGFFGIPEAFVEDLTRDADPRRRSGPSSMDIGEEEEEEIEVMPSVIPATPNVPATPEPAQEPEPVKEPTPV